MAPKPLDYELLNENVKKVAYAVKGELYLRASKLQKEGKKSVSQAKLLCNLFPLVNGDLEKKCAYSDSQGLPGIRKEFADHLQGMFNRTIRLLEAGIEPVYVFDGQPPELKKQELAKRYLKRKDATNDLNSTIETGDLEGIEKYNKRTVKVTKQHNEDCKRLLRLMGVPTIEAPCEAEAQCAALCKSDKVFAVASENMDTLTFGVPRFLYHLMDPSSKKISVMEFDVSKVLEELRLTMDQFIDLCILSGCDYCDNIKSKLSYEILYIQQV
ncbi:flap endonuclease 1-A-like [Zingiber officinale]|uniref:flap endonuclease 1-A-like n=1 Tax=Zingiber officinale TaxID=94328 RepID=UPI001C4C16D5|nr:flap endonuclease 1-A-like [Zingiber officinale]